MYTTIHLDSGINIRYNKTGKKCTVIESPEAIGTVIIPRFVEIEKKKYPITAIASYAFSGNKIEFLDFPEDSQMESFESQCLSNSYIKKIKFPPSLKNLQNWWNKDLQGLTEIDVSLNNRNFQFYNNDYLLGKSQENSDIFDVLIYARSNITDAVIPPQVKIIKEMSFGFHKNLKSVKFTNNSIPISIENNAFMYSTIQTLYLPTLIENIADDCFSCVRDLVNIEISSDNVCYSFFDKKYLVKKSNQESEIFDVILFARRDIESACIPSFIKVINNYAFQNCKKLISLTFELNSSLESIGQSAFHNSPGPEEIVFPPSLKLVNVYSLANIFYLKSIVFLSKSIIVGPCCFLADRNLESVSFPNADEIDFKPQVLTNVPDDVKVFCKRGVEIKRNHCKESIVYLENENI